MVTMAIGNANPVLINLYLQNLTSNYREFMSPAF